MNFAHCPLCQTKLETIDVAPCWECGHRPNEIDEALQGKHKYAEMRVFGDMTAVLCDFCQVDFGSWNPEFFGLPPRTRLGYEHMTFVRELPEVRISKDKWCPVCGHRLAFLEFVERAREWAGGIRL